MAGKRRATSDLNHDNWNQEEEPEDAGSFTRASQDELKKRVIKTAKRRLPTSSEVDSNKKSAFANFTGLSRTPAQPSNDSSSSNQKNLSILIEKLTDKGLKKNEVACNVPNTNEKEGYSDKTINQESTPTTNEKINGKSSGHTEETDGSNTNENADNEVDSTNDKISAEAGNEITESRAGATDDINRPEEVETNSIDCDTTEVAKDERKEREGSSKISERIDAKND